MKITVVILTKNEEKNIERAIKSVQFCNEIIIIDDYSSDKTLDIVYKVLKVHKVFQRKLNNDFAGQRNFGMTKAKNEWVFFLDADEEVSDELQNEIKSIHRNFQFPISPSTSSGSRVKSRDNFQSNPESKILNSKDTEVAAFYIKRRDFFWGEELKYGETMKLRNQGIIRLFNKGSGRWEGKVHEVYKLKSQISNVKTFHNYLNHFPHQTVKEFLEEVNFYSSLRAKELLVQGKSSNIFEIIFYPLGKFLLTYFVKLGFLDGVQGFVYAFFMSFHSFLVRTKHYQYSKLNNLGSHSGER
ncbi:hypothetical protein A2767_00290 [Candidatus Roizmanbacteria bacterium RIFCSPHIGHO2_01_FULL_35_10]|uniref:Glycosyltransferase 2-like domain-containing protein n=1 Tax=Candidatus Roizmanbacteria bacterium RIFCSPLOWO2_01_FULL_35_13 TaxID=1802055 RepID=A0A1F7IHF3_9BACT|nr:MAG: hypothetical protein A2767_00290 [Candidatus Roizmanbacteria bacterium RIFCSPHIGHO2_01_FULL_35_10]OGK42787.1 MAG: hypothetical protein A3A74_01060 [Candidatus Roizmanbacteria bacterium RIFCSPLOWO2_01_FULL_35_13]